MRCKGGRRGEKGGKGKGSQNFCEHFVLGPNPHAKVRLTRVQGEENVSAPLRKRRPLQRGEP